MTNASDYLTSSESALARADSIHGSSEEYARLNMAEAQVIALQAVAAAIDRLAEAVENLRS